MLFTMRRTTPSSSRVSCPVFSHASTATSSACASPRLACLRMLLMYFAISSAKLLSVSAVKVRWPELPPAPPPMKMRSFRKFAHRASVTVFELLQKNSTYFTGAHLIRLRGECMSSSRPWAADEVSRASELCQCLCLFPKPRDTFVFEIRCRCSTHVRFVSPEPDFQEPRIFRDL